MATLEEAVEEAAKLGKEAGESAASWFFDGNTSRDTYARVLRGIEEGDPEIMDALPAPNLSGEWADDPTPRSLFEECTGADAHAESSWNIDTYDAWSDAICTAWEEAASSAVHDAIERTAREQLAPAGS